MQENNYAFAIRVSAATRLALERAAAAELHVGGSIHRDVPSGLVAEAGDTVEEAAKRGAKAGPQRHRCVISARWWGWCPPSKSGGAGPRRPVAAGVPSAKRRD